MKKHLRLATAAFAATTLLLAGCNGDDDTTDTDTTVDDGTIDDGLGDDGLDDDGLDDDVEG